MPANLLPTIVKNTSGVRKPFPFLPPHGITLDADQTYSIDGDLLSGLIQQRPAYANGLAEALNAGDLEIVQSAPAVLTAGEGVAGAAADYDRAVLLQNIPSRVVGLFWPGEDVRLGRSVVGQPIVNLKNYVLGQPAAVGGAFKLTAGGAFTASLGLPSVAADVFADGEAGLTLSSTNLSTPVGLLASGMTGLNLFPEGFDEDLIAGDEYLGVSCLISRPAVASGSGTSGLALVANGVLGWSFLSTQAATSITSVTAPTGWNPTDGNPVSLTGSASPSLCNIASGVDAGTKKHYLLTLLYKVSTDDLILRFNKTCSVTAANLAALTGAAALSLANVPGVAICNYAGFHPYHLGPVAVFRTTDVSGDLTEIEDFLTDLIPGISLG